MESREVECLCKSHVRGRKGFCATGSEAIECDRRKSCGQTPPPVPTQHKLSGKGDKGCGVVERA